MFRAINPVATGITPAGKCVCVSNSLGKRLKINITVHHLSICQYIPYSLNEKLFAVLFWIKPNGGFQQWGYPKMDGL